MSADMRKGSYDFSGEYAASEALVRENLAQYGELEVCELHKGWFENTIGLRPVTRPVRVVYIDCDLAKGTFEVLTGSLPGLAADGRVFSQDAHIRQVQELLEDPKTWEQLGRGLRACQDFCVRGI
jgi:Macrocin-O-methyltransferase (TylF)